MIIKNNTIDADDGETILKEVQKQLVNGLTLISDASYKLNTAKRLIEGKQKKWVDEWNNDVALGYAKLDTVYKSIKVNLPHIHEK